MTDLTDRADAATMRLKGIIGTLRQLGEGSTDWCGYDTYLPDALCMLGNDLKGTLQVLRELHETVLQARPKRGPIEAMHSEYRGRTGFYDFAPDRTPGKTPEERLEWLSEPADRAQTAFPDTAKEWAAKVLLMTLDGSTLEREGHLQALVDDARATLGIREAGETA